MILTSRSNSSPMIFGKRGKSYKTWKSNCSNLKKKKCEIYAEQYAEYVGKEIEFTRTPGCAKKKGFFLGVGFDDYFDVYFPLIYKANKDGKASKTHYHQCDVPKMYEFDKNVKICE